MVHGFPALADSYKLAFSEVVMPIAIDLTGNRRDIEAILALAKERQDLASASEPTR